MKIITTCIFVFLLTTCTANAKRGIDPHVMWEYYSKIAEHVADISENINNTKATLKTVAQSSQEYSELENVLSAMELYDFQLTLIFNKLMSIVPNYDKKTGKSTHIQGCNDACVEELYTRFTAFTGLAIGTLMPERLLHEGGHFGEFRTPTGKKAIGQFFKLYMEGLSVLDGLLGYLQDKVKL